jgi:hypothetical protein
VVATVFAQCDHLEKASYSRAEKPTPKPFRQFEDHHRPASVFSVAADPSDMAGGDSEPMASNSIAHSGIAIAAASEGRTDRDGDFMDKAFEAVGGQARFLTESKGVEQPGRSLRVSDSACAHGTPAEQPGIE